MDNKRQRREAQVDMEVQSFQSAMEHALRDPGLLQFRQIQRAKLSPALSFGRHFGPPSPTARPAAVMLLIATAPEHEWLDWTVPLTVRPYHLTSHPGQISLPGGRVEVGESLQRAAERELEEELGLVPFPGIVIGRLQPLYVYNSDYYVTPFVAISPPLADCAPCPNEVERVIHLPLRTLIDANARREARFTRGLAEWDAPVIVNLEDQIWGATAIILSELAAVIEHIASSPER